MNDEIEFQIPDSRSKPQFQIPNSKFHKPQNPLSRLNLEVAIWNVSKGQFGIWNLEFS